MIKRVLSMKKKADYCNLAVSCIAVVRIFFIVKPQTTLSAPLSFGFGF